MEVDDKGVVASALAGLGDAFADRGDLVAARSSYEESLALRNQAGEKQAAAETEIALARLSIEEGRAADAETAARKCSEQFRQERQTDDELAARALLIEVLLARGQQANAQKEMKAGQHFAGKSENSLLRLQFALVSARVALTSDHPRSSQRPLEQVVQLARLHGFVGIELDAGLALAQLATRIEPAATPHGRLRILEKDARAKLRPDRTQGRCRPRLTLFGKRPPLRLFSSRSQQESAYNLADHLLPGECQFGTCDLRYHDSWLPLPALYKWLPDLSEHFLAFGEAIPMFLAFRR